MTWNPRAGTRHDEGVTEALFMPLTRNGVDPVPELARRREEEPVSRLDLFGNTVWLVTRHADVRAVLATLACGFGAYRLARRPRSGR